MHLTTHKDQYFTYIKYTLPDGLSPLLDLGKQHQFYFDFPVTPVPSRCLDNQSVSKYLLSDYFVPGTILSAGNSAVNTECLLSGS